MSLAQWTDPKLGKYYLKILHSSDFRGEISIFGKRILIIRQKGDTCDLIAMVSGSEGVARRGNETNMRQRNKESAKEY